MSTYWDIYCRSCSEGAGFDTKSDQQLSVLLGKINDWAKVSGLLSDLDVEVRLLGDDGGALHHFPKFAQKHIRHDVTLRNEYGNFSDECGVWATCPTCSTHKPCELKRGHDGEHKWAQK